MLLQKWTFGVKHSAKNIISSPKDIISTAKNIFFHGHTRTQDQARRPGSDTGVQGVERLQEGHAASAHSVVR